MFDDISINFEFSCVNSLGDEELGSSYLKFNILVRVKDVNTKKEIKTKVNLIITFLIITILIITIGLYLLKKEKKRSSENLTTSKKDYSINL